MRAACATPTLCGPGVADRWISRSASALQLCREFAKCLVAMGSTTPAGCAISTTIVIGSTSGGRAVADAERTPRGTIDVISRELPRCPECRSPDLTPYGKHRQRDDTVRQYFQCKSCPHKFVIIWE